LPSIPLKCYNNSPKKERMEVHYMYTYEDSIMKMLFAKVGEEKEGERENNGGGELVQGTLYACVESLQ
jgi:hypothetical protein